MPEKPKVPPFLEFLMSGLDPESAQRAKREQDICATHSQALREALWAEIEAAKRAGTHSHCATGAAFDVAAAAAASDLAEAITKPEHVEGASEALIQKFADDLRGALLAVLVKKLVEKEQAKKDAEFAASIGRKRDV